MSWHWILIAALAASLVTFILMFLLNRLRFINIGFDGVGEKLASRKQSLNKFSPYGWKSN
jgi:hypothetical protein